MHTQKQVEGKPSWLAIAPELLGISCAEAACAKHKCMSCHVVPATKPSPTCVISLYLIFTGGLLEMNDDFVRMFHCSSRSSTAPLHDTGDNAVLCKFLQRKAAAVPLDPWQT
jgi:hypothetical protein